MSSQERLEVHLLGFGEPASASRSETAAYLERIFRANAGLDGDRPAADVERRCRDLAERRAPGLLADYETIGGSPLLAQCTEQARALTAELSDRGWDVTVRVGMQFTAPFIGDIARQALEAGATRIVALPLYPLCGASTTVAALEDLHGSLARAAGEGSASRVPPVAEITGWHAHPGFVGVVADEVRKAVDSADVSFSDPDTLLYFSAHGTPVKYLREGSRYDRYVEELCSRVAGRLGVGEYVIGYQNHSNRGIEWTAPSNEDLIPALPATQLVVVPISFIHEQSETLVELDVDLSEYAAEHGKRITRVPVPHAAPGLIEALADLVQPLLSQSARADGDSAAPGLHACTCRPGAETWCLNPP